MSRFMTTLRLQSIPPVFIFCFICPSRPHYPRFLSYSTTLVLSSVAYVCLCLCHICIWHTNSLQRCVRSSQKGRFKHHLFVSVSHCLTRTQWLCFISGVAGEADIKIDKMEFNGRRRKLLAWGINLHAGLYSGFSSFSHPVQNTILFHQHFCLLLLHTKSLIVMPLLCTLVS